MNWSKAKTILIILFLIADIFLLYELYPGFLGNNKMIDDESTKEVMKYLEKQGIYVRCLVPKAISPKAPLTVKYKYIDSQYALKNFFHAPEEVVIKNFEDKQTMEDESIYIEIYKNGEFIYTNKKLMENKAEELDEKAALNSIEGFLKKLGIEEKDLYDIIQNIDRNYVKLNCSQGYKDTFLDQSFLEVLATNEGVAYMKMLWFEVENNGKNKNDIMDPMKALIKLADELAQPTEQQTEEDDRIVNIYDIRLGYYFDTEIEQVKEFDIVEVKEGTAIPSWRIKTDKGNIYINAYNGTVEKN